MQLRTFIALSIIKFLPLYHQARCSRLGLLSNDLGYFPMTSVTFQWLIQMYFLKILGKYQTFSNVWLDLSYSLALILIGNHAEQKLVKSVGTVPLYSYMIGFLLPNNTGVLTCLTRTFKYNKLYRKVKYQALNMTQNTCWK